MLYLNFRLELNIIRAMDSVANEDFFDPSEDLKHRI